MTPRGAVVLKSEKNRLIVLTCDGEFRSLKWRAPLPKPGEEVIIREPAMTPRRLATVALAAAFLLLAVLPSVAWAVKPVAYITLDANSSIGLEVSRLGRIRSAQGLDSEGDRLLQQVAVRGLLPSQAVKKLVEQAAADGLVSGGPDDVILISQVGLQSVQIPPLAELEAAADQGLAAAGKEAFVAVEEASREELEEARKQNTSLNRIRLLKKLDGMPQVQSPAKGIKPDAKKKENLKKILADSGKKAAEVFEQGSLKGKKKEKGDHGKGSPGPGKKSNEEMPDNKKPKPKKQDQEEPAATKNKDKQEQGSSSGDAKSLKDKQKQNQSKPVMRRADKYQQGKPDSGKEQLQPIPGTKGGSRRK